MTAVELAKTKPQINSKNMLGTAEKGTIHGRTVIWQNVTSKRTEDFQ